MKNKELGRTGILLPAIGIGTWDYRGGTGPLRRGIEAGAFLLDTGETYGTESIVGEAVRGIRDRVFIATKVSETHFRRNDFLQSVDRSLTNLGTDRIDLLQLHRPTPHIPIQETMDAMAEVIRAGKVRFAGVSNFSLEQLREAQSALPGYPVVSNQLRYNIIDRTIEHGLLEFCRTQGVTVIAYSPLARGLARITDCDPRGTLQALVFETGRSPAQIVLNWCISKLGVVAIPGANTDAHMLENCASSDWSLTEEQLQLLDSTIQFRRRNRFDSLVRKYTPSSLGRVAKTVLARLPRAMRRRLT